MSIRTTALLLALCTAIVGAAQTPISQSRTAGSDRSPRTGKYTITLEPSSEVFSLAQLVETADLIVDGTVTLTLPSVNYNPNRRTAIQTDSRISVNALIKGSVPDDKGFVLLAQEGGKLGELEIEAWRCPVVKPGVRYIFFLAPDERKLPTNDTGLSRYYAVGVWSGLVRVESNRVQFAEAADASLRQHDSTSVDDFVSLVLDTLHHRIMPPPSERPIVPWPLQPGDPRAQR